MLRAILTLTLALLLASCGGGSAPAAVSIYGDSATTGDYLEAGQVFTTSPTPAEMMNAAGPVKVISHAANGVQLRELLAGGPVLMGAAVGQTVAALGFQLASDPSQIIVIGVGMVDAIFGEITMLEYVEQVRQAVATVRAAGKTPVLRGFNSFVTNDVITPARQARLQEFDGALRRYSAVLGVPYLEIPGDPEIRSDGLHPTQAYHRRIAVAIAGQLAQIASAPRADRSRADAWAAGARARAWDQVAAAEVHGP
jgi:lysophospholipase L1-like esterase